MDLNDVFTAVKEHYAGDLPFVIYRKPDAVNVCAFLQRDNNLHTLNGDYDKRGFLFAPFNNKEESVLFPLAECRLIKSSFKLRTEEVSPPLPKEILTPENKIEKKEHIKLVQKGINEIETTSLKKVVLSRVQEVKVASGSDSDVFMETFSKLLTAYTHAFVYCWYHPEVGLWVGATPETLFSLEEKTFRTVALAGTQRYMENGKTIWSEKEKEEQSIVTEYIENSLQNLVPILMVSKPTTSRAGNLVHLKTEIGGTINNRICNVRCLIEKLHPTPAVCGFPREKAKEFILDNENYDREFYAGFLGELHLEDLFFTDQGINGHDLKKSKTCLYVNLRCMKVEEDLASIYVGGGITAVSDPEKEWMETVYKTHTILQILS